MTKSITIQMLVLVLLVAGCAKRPALSQASAPAPTGTSTRVEAPAPTSPAPAPPAPPPAAAPPVTPAPPPAAPPARPAPRDFVAVPDLKDIHFDFDKSTIRPGDAKVLDANITWLKSHPDHLVMVEGHCDERGTNEYNLALGERRARATMDYLVTHGIAENRISILSYGEERPVCTEHAERCWSRNRRAHFLTKPQ
jgi:peptidoglycan-associated lipoprotein